MHEAAIASSILEIAAAAAQGRAIRTIHLRIGELTGIAGEALEFAFECMRPGTVAAGATLEIERIPLTGICPQCQWAGRLEAFACPHCSSVVDVSTGRDLEVTFLELEEEAEYATRG